MELNFSTGKKTSATAPSTKTTSVPVSFGGLLVDAPGSIEYLKQTIGYVERKEVRFPADLGEAHPFDSELTEAVYDNVPLVHGAVDKYVDYIVGPGIKVRSEDKTAEQLCNDFIRDSKLNIHLGPWIVDACTKPGGYLEIIFDKKTSVPINVKTLDGKYMYVKRNDKGSILGYSQYVGGWKSFDRSKIVPFDRGVLAVLHLKKKAGAAYGMGMVFPNLKKVDQFLQADQSLHTLVKRKANSPIHAKLGIVAGDRIIDEPTEEAITSFGASMQTLTDKTEITTGPSVDLKTIDFGPIGDKFEFVINNDIKQLVYGFQVPLVLMGDGDIAEGLAEEQGESFEKNIWANRSQIATILVEIVFRRLLDANNRGDSRIDIEWGQPSTREANDRLDRLARIAALPDLQPALKNLIEADIAKALGYDTKFLLAPDDEREHELDQPQPIIPGANRGERPVPNDATPSVQAPLPMVLSRMASQLSDDAQAEGDPFNEETTVTEWAGFNLKDYLQHILDAVAKTDFNLLAATNAVESAAGYLSNSQVESLRTVLSEGFSGQSTIREIAARIGEEVKPGDLFNIKDGKITTKVLSSADTRPVTIARSEVTRLAAEGARRNYEENGFEQYRWVSSIGARTCPECDEMNGEVFGVDEAPTMPPLHSNCRCTIVPVTRFDA